jgi:hypothetical protein
MIQGKPMIRQRNAKLIIKGQERFQQVLLVQRQPAVYEPLGRVIVRKEDVVYVYPNSFRNARENLEELVTDVAAKLNRVARIDEEDVVGLQAREEVDVDLFNGLLHQLNLQIGAD